MSDDIKNVDFGDDDIQYERNQFQHSCSIDSELGGSYDMTCKACVIERREDERLKRETEAENAANANAPY